MQREYKYILNITDGIPKIQGKQQFDMDLKAIGNAKMVMTVKKYHKSRSLNQNGFYWSNFIEQEIECFKEYWGETYTKQTVHDWNKTNFFGEEKVIELTGEIVKAPASSAKQSTVEFDECLEKCREWFRINFEWEIGYPLQQQEIDL